MAQPDDFGFSEEAGLLKDSARRFFSDNLPTERLHALVAADPEPERMSTCDWDRDAWKQMVELGWATLAVPEAQGGLGLPVVAVAGLMEEVGRAACPCPLGVTLGASYVLAECSSGGQEPLAEIAAGHAATLAVSNSWGNWYSEPEVSCDGDTLHGTAWFVQDARKADRLLVGARSGSGLSLYWVATDTPGVSIQSDAIVDLTRDQAHVRFDGATAQLVSDRGLEALSGAMPAIWTLLSADIVGAAEWQLQTTVEYAGTRQQFDRPLGFFQAVKHPLVDVMIQIDQSKSLLYNAACAIDCEPERAAQYAHMAKASASETAAFASGRSVQCHGGIGFTWECYLHLYFKRQKHSQMLWGDAAWHRARLAEILIDEAA
jgi:alkylation response protein AidB-like acyl-CoA dehydrogenase